MPKDSKSYYLGWVPSKDHIPEQPNLTATRHHGWSWHREYKVFSSAEELESFVADYKSDGTTGGAWSKWEDYKAAVDKYQAQRKVSKS